MTGILDEARRRALVHRMIALHPNSHVDPRSSFLQLQDPTQPLDPTWSRLVFLAGDLAIWQEKRVATLRYVLERLRDNVSVELKSAKSESRYAEIDWSKDGDVVCAFPGNMQSLASQYLSFFPRERPDLLARTGLDEFLRLYMEGKGFEQKIGDGKVYGKRVEAMIERLENKHERAVELRKFLGLSSG